MLRRRNGWNIGAQRVFDVSVRETERPHVARDHPVGLLDELRRPQRQVVVGDGLRARHQAEGEAGRVHVPEAVDMLEPDQRDVGGMLGLLHLLAPPGLEMGERRRDVAPAGGAERLVERDRRPPSPAWCRSRWRNAPSPWRRRCSTTLSATQRSQRMVGKLRQIERLVMSRWPCELVGEQAFDEARRRRLVELVEPGAREGLRDRSR